MRARVVKLIYTYLPGNVDKQRIKPHAHAHARYVFARM